MLSSCAPSLRTKALARITDSESDSLTDYGQLLENDEKDKRSCVSLIVLQTAAIY